MGTTTSKIGQSEVIVDAGYDHRWYAATGPYVNQVLEDYVKTPYTAANVIGSWLTTPSGASTNALVAGALGGNMLITTAAAENNGITSQQVLGEAFLPTANNEIYFGIRFQISDATESDFLVGLAITNQTPLGGITDGIYFRKIDGTTQCNFVVETAATETSTAALTVVAATWYILEFKWNGTNLYFYVDGVLTGTPVVTNIPTVEYLTPTICFLTGEAVAKTMTVDWIRVIQTVG